MKLGKGSRSAVAVAAVVVAAASGCSTKAPESSSSGGGDAAADVQTDIGVEGETIKLGVLTDLTGVFAALGKDITNANTLYWSDHKVCDTYDVKLNVQDTGYVPQTGVQLYSSIKDSILAMQQTIGSPINTALAQDYEADQIVNFPSAWGETLTQIPGTGVLGPTYDVEMSNGYDYLFKQGLLKEGDTVGHIYFEGEYGATGLAGTKKVAEEKNLKVVEAQIKSTDQDMSAQVSQFAVGPASRPGANTGLLPRIGTSRPCASATAATDAVCPGATVRAIALTPAALNWVPCALMSWSVDLI